MWIAELPLLVYFIYVVAYTLVFAVGGILYRTPRITKAGKKARFCVLMPSYREDAVILDTAQKNLLQTYPASHFDVVVIADSLQPETLDTLRALPLKVVPVSFENSTKVKALNKCLAQLPSYDYAVILDADNVMEADFLERMNDLFQATGRAVIQGQRKPKNKNNTLAFLDGLSEAINNHIFRQGTAGLGMSSAINGSGIAFEFSLLKNKLAPMNSVGGFDRELELLLLEEGKKVYYYREAVVYDEKVSRSKSFQNQRTRWIYSQYHYLAKYFAAGMRRLFRGDLTYFNSAVLRNIQLPRLLNIGLLTMTVAAFWFLRDYLYFGFAPWAALFVLNTLAVFISIPKEYFTIELLKAILKLPLIFIQMFLILFRLKGSNKRFIHTPHGLAPPSENPSS